MNRTFSPSTRRRPPTTSVRGAPRLHPLAGLLVWALASVLGVGLAQAPAAAVLRIGVIVDETGSASALGGGEANTVRLMSDELAGGGPGGFSVEIVLLDSASTTDGVLAALDELMGAGGVHAVVCCTLSASSLVAISPVQAANVPMISLAAAAPIARPAAQRRFVFQAAQSDSLMVGALAADMRRQGVTDVTVLATSDAFGESGVVEMQTAFAAAGVRIDKVIRYDRAADSFVAPTLAAVLDRPQAVLVWGLAEDSAQMVRALRDRQFGGTIYLSHGVGAPAFLEQAGEAAEGVRIVTGPTLVAEQLASSHPSREVAVEYRRAYTDRFGAGSVSSFGAHAYDAVNMIVQAAGFAAEHYDLDLADTTSARVALRSALERMEAYVGAGGVFDYTGSDHMGLDGRAALMATVKEGRWQLAE